jgi:hypothetical protein
MIVHDRGQGGNPAFEANRVLNEIYGRLLAKLDTEGN